MYSFRILFLFNCTHNLTHCTCVFTHKIKNKYYNIIIVTT